MDLLTEIVDLFSKRAVLQEPPPGYGPAVEYSIIILEIVLMKLQNFYRNLPAYKNSTVNWL